jgi:hypothetical protein
MAMDDTLTRFWNDLVGRLTGPMTFRLILQPVMARRTSSECWCLVSSWT